MVNRLKEFFDIAFKYETRFFVVFALFSKHCFKPANALVSSFVFPAGIRVINESSFEYRIKNGKNGMMNDAVSHASFVNMALFGVSNVKASITGVLIASAY